MKRRKEERQKMKKCRASVIAALLCMGFALSACGSKGAEQISEYGGGEVSSREAGQEPASGKPEGTETGDTQNSGTMDHDAAMEAAESKSNQSLREKLGGEKVTYNDSFSVGKLAVNMNVEYEVPDVETVPSYLAKTPDTATISEAELVKNLLGDSAEEVRRTLSRTKGDSEYVLSACAEFYYSLYPDSYDPASAGQGIPDCSGWEDVGKDFYHTYEGTFNGTDYQLMIASMDGSRQICFYPKNPGTLVARPELTTVKYADEGTVLYVDPEDRDKDYELSTKLLDNPENQSKQDAATQLSMVKSFLKDKLHLNLPEGGVAFASYRTIGMDASDESITMDSGDFDRRELVFLDPKSITKDSLGDAVLNGYQASLTYTLAGLPYASVFESSDSNTGSFWVTDDGIVGMNLYLDYIFEDMLSENVALLSFENAMLSVRNGVTEQLDLSKVTGSSAEVGYVELAYYPITSPEKKGEVTYAPVWTISLESNGYQFACVLVNAMDGSVVDIIYRSDMG
ncbi:MAG: hypothetical protein IJM25_10030 [Eubacterium sp.]|nr:hypothetical protein [Eubacterium sp.]